jgi:hypothetical protein
MEPFGNRIISRLAQRRWQTGSGIHPHNRYMPHLVANSSAHKGAATIRGCAMEKVIWSETPPEYLGTAPSPWGRETLGSDASGLDTARGLLIGLAISQIFWLALALFVL